jgi:hypothetical protein
VGVGQGETRGPLYSPHTRASCHPNSNQQPQNQTQELSDFLEEISRLQDSGVSFTQFTSGGGRGGRGGRGGSSGRRGGSSSNGSSSARARAGARAAGGGAGGMPIDLDGWLMSGQDLTDVADLLGLSIEDLVEHLEEIDEEILREEQAGGGGGGSSYSRGGAARGGGGAAAGRGRANGSPGDRVEMDDDVIWVYDEGGTRDTSDDEDDDEDDGWFRDAKRYYGEVG